MKIFVHRIRTDVNKKMVFLLISLLFIIVLSSCSQTINDPISKHLFTEAQRYAFGTYEQDGIIENGTESIVWCLMEQKGNKALLVSEYALDTVVPSDEFEDIYFRESKLQKWLDDFYENAFTDYEKNCFRPDIGSKGVFIPTSDVFISDQITDFSCSPTIYAKINGVYTTSSDSDAKCWWFADCAENGSLISCATDTDKLSSVPVNTPGIGIRPAIWVDLDMLLNNYTLFVDGYDTNKLFFVGDSPLQDNVTVTQLINDETKAVIKNNYNVYPEVFTQKGRQYVTYEYNGQKAVLGVFVYPAIKDIEIVSLPQKTSYFPGEEIDITGLSIKVLFESENDLVLNKYFSFWPKTTSADPADSEQLVNVELCGKTASFSLSLQHYTSLDIVPYREVFEYGSKFDPNDFIISYVNMDGSTSTLTASDELTMISENGGYYTEPVINLSFSGQTRTVEIMLSKKITDLYISDSDQSFCYGQKIPDQLSATVVYSSGYREEIPVSTILGADSIWERAVSGSYTYSSLYGAKELATKTYDYSVSFNMKKIMEMQVSVNPLPSGSKFSLDSCDLLLVYSYQEQRTQKQTIHLKDEVPAAFTRHISYQVSSESDPDKDISDQPLKNGTYLLTVSLDDTLSHEKLSAQTSFAVGNHRYQIVMGHYSWSEAKERCESAGGHLATITSDSEQKEILKLTGGNTNLWLGGYYSQNEWYWVTGELWNYQNWGEGEPNGGENEPCLVLWPEFWNDLCDDSYEQEGYILEFDY